MFWITVDIMNLFSSISISFLTSHSRVFQYILALTVRSILLLWKIGTVNSYSNESILFGAMDFCVFSDAVLHMKYYEKVIHSAKKLFPSAANFCHELVHYRGLWRYFSISYAPVISLYIGIATPEKPFLPYPISYPISYLLSFNKLNCNVYPC